MTLIFQYGSNLSTARLNGEKRLKGAAQPLFIARTIELFEFDFTVWSNYNNCAAADIVANPDGRSIYGMVYEIPERLVYRNHPANNGERTLDEIEGEGSSYIRRKLELVKKDGTSVKAETYVVKSPRFDLVTEWDYVRHIMVGLNEHSFPAEYINYVKARVIANNAALSTFLHDS